MTKSVRAMRHYQPIWEQLKEVRSVRIVLAPHNLTENQAKQHYATTKKAITKEKYMDTVFKCQFPDAELKSAREGLIINFKLELNDCDPFGKDF